MKLKKHIIFTCFIGLCIFDRCGVPETGSNVTTSGNKSSLVDTSNTVEVGIDIQSSDLSMDGGLELISLTTINLKVTGCTSGYTQSFSTSGTVYLYANDFNCVIKIVSLVTGGETYQVFSSGALDPTGNSFDPVVSHITQFQSTTNSSHNLYAQVQTQIPSPVISGASFQASLFAMNVGSNYSGPTGSNILHVVPLETSVDLNQATQTVTFAVDKVSQVSTNSSIAVNYTIGGNAVAGTDYTAPAGTFTMAGTSTAVNVDIPLASETSTPGFTKTLEFNFGAGNYYSYPIGLITLTNSLLAEPPTTNLVCHYDYTSFVNTTGISTWTDLSSNAISASQSTSSYRPTLTTASDPVLSLNSALYNGSSQYLIVPNSTGINTASSSAKVITMSFVTGSNVTRTQFLYSQGTSTSGLSLYILNGLLYANVWGSSWGPIYASAAVSANSFYTASLAVDSVAGTIKLYLSGSLASSASGVSTIAAAGTVNGIGGSSSTTKLHNGTAISNMGSSTCYNSAACFFGGQILEFAYYNASALSNTTILGHQYFLMNKLGKNVASITKYVTSTVNNNSGNVPYAFEVLLRSPASTDTTLTYTVNASSTAVADTDYNALPGSVVIPAGYTSAFIPVTVINNTNSTSNRTLMLDLATSTSYAVSTSSPNATLTIVNTNVYSPPNNLVWFDAAQNVTVNGSNGVTNWNDIATNSTCTHPIAATQATSANSPIYNSTNHFMTFSTNDVLGINSNTCIDNLSVTLESIVVVFKTGADVTTDQILYKQGDASTGLSIAISNENLNFSAYKSWKRNASISLSANTYYAVIIEFNTSTGLTINLSQGFGTSSVTWSSASGSAPSSGLTALTNNGISIGGVLNGVQFYSSNSNGYVSTSSSNVKYLQSGYKVYELIFMNNSILTTGGSNLTTLQNYLVNKYQGIN